ncbi:MAG: protein translocase subunit SecD [Acidobacteriota bacterium]
MNNTNMWKIGLIVLVIGFSILMLYPPDKKINLGLDLKGGMHLVLEVQTNKAIEIQTEQSIEQLKSLLKESSIKYENIRRDGTNKIEMYGISFDDERKIKDILDDEFKDYEYVLAGTQTTLTLIPNVEMRMRDLSIDQAIETIRNRIDEFGVSNAAIQKIGLGGGDKILVQLPGVDDPGRVKGLIKNTAMLEFRAVVSGPFATEEDAMKDQGGALADDMKIFRTNSRRMDKGYYILRTSTVITGKDLKNAKRGQDGYGAPAVSFTLNSQGASKIRRFSAANIGKRMAVVLDDRIETAPTIQDVLSYDNQITGNYTVEEVNDMALVLRSGALPAPLKYLEERTIGPSLGADSIRKGLYASVIGLIIVMVFMLIFYRGAGINSVVALVFNLIILMGVMAYFDATLTVPGIAGIILTIGMSVDANVLIFEKIKEDLRAGKAPKSAIDSGFKKAFVTIFDANLTTIIAAVFLFQFGTGPIQGFSVTLMIGIIASMFTAVFVSRVIFDLVYSGKKKIKKISI